MKELTKRRYGRARQWPLALLMAVLSVGVILLAGWGYTVLRADYLVAPSGGEISSGDLLQVPVEEELLARYGVESVSFSPDESMTVVSTVRGYKSDIRVRSVFDADGKTLLSVQVLSQNETEYLGERVQTEAFLSQFAGRLAPMKLWQEVRVGSPIDALSGATVSSQAVVDAVNNAWSVIKTLE